MDPVSPPPCAMLYILLWGIFKKTLVSVSYFITLPVLEQSVHLSIIDSLVVIPSPQIWHKFFSSLTVLLFEFELLFDLGCGESSKMYSGLWLRFWRFDGGSSWSAGSKILRLFCKKVGAFLVNKSFGLFYKTLPSRMYLLFL